MRNTNNGGREFRRGDIVSNAAEGKGVIVWPTTADMAAKQGIDTVLVQFASGARKWIERGKLLVEVR
jgi:hypothetical protein